MTNVMRGVVPANDGLNAIIRQYNLPLPVLNQDQGISILSGTALEVFAESNPFECKTGKPLGLLAEGLVIAITCLYEDLMKAVPNPDDVCSSIPILNLYGQIEEKYINLSKQAYLIDTIGKGE